MVGTPDALRASRAPACVTIAVLGEPKGKGRGRVGKLHNGRPVVFTPEATRSYEASLRHAASQEMGARPPMEGPVEMDLLAQFLPPASWSQKKRDAALRGEILPAKKPDASNVLKAAEDAFNQIVYRDDAQIVTSVLRKRYGTQAALIVTVKETATP